MMELWIKWNYCGEVHTHSRAISFSEAKRLLRFGYNGNVSKAMIVTLKQERDLHIDYRER